MGIFSAGASVMNTAQTNEANRKIAAMNNKTNLQLAHEQNDWNVAQWQRENEYNDPSAQAQRLRAAGLSDAAAAQSVSNIPAANLQSADLANQQAPPPMQTADFSGLNQYSLMSLKEAEQKIRSLKAEADIKEEEAANAPALIFNKVQGLEWLNKKLANDVELSSKSMGDNIRAAKHRADNYESFTNYYKQLTELEKYTTDLTRQKFDFLEKYNEKEIEKVGEEIKEIIERTKLHSSNERYLDAQTAKTYVEKRILDMGSPEAIATKIAQNLLNDDGTINEDKACDYISNLFGSAWSLLKRGYTNVTQPLEDFLNEYLLENAPRWYRNSMK